MIRNIEIDKKTVYEIATTSSQYIIMNAYETGNIDEFGKVSGILNKLNYGTVISRLRKALEELYFEGKCDRCKCGRKCDYNFTKSLGQHLDMIGGNDD